MERIKAGPSSNQMEKSTFTLVEPANKLAALLHILGITLKLKWEKMLWKDFICSKTSWNFVRQSVLELRRALKGKPKIVEALKEFKKYIFKNQLITTKLGKPEDR